jgi:hypothetical protein
MNKQSDERAEGLAQSVTPPENAAQAESNKPIRIADGLDAAQETRWAQIVARAWDDEEFRRRLLACPSETLREAGFDLPDDAAVEVIDQEPQERSDEVGYLRLPERPAEDDLFEEDLNLSEDGLRAPSNDQ